MPSDITRQSLRAAGQRAIDLFTELYDGPETSAVDPNCDYAALQRLFADTIADEGVGLEHALDDFCRLVLPNSVRTPHPLYLGLVNSSPLPAAVLGDLLVSMLNNNGGAAHQGPAMWAAEQESLREFAKVLGLGDVTGMLLPGGTFANLQGLLHARTAKCPDWVEQGPAALSAAPVFYVCEAAHFCVARAAMVMGLGSAGIVTIPATGRGNLDVSALARQIDRDRSAGRRPFAVAATLGTTGTGAIDPLAAIAEVCRDNDLWLHVDACYGGAALLLPELRARFAGIEFVDSIAIDPHKWFFIPITAAIMFSRHPELELKTFDVEACYIPRGGPIDPCRRGIPTSRRNSGLAVWMALRAHGWSTIRDAVRRNIELTRLLEELLTERGFAVLPDGRLSVACARWEPPGWTPEDVDNLQLAITKNVVTSGKAWFATVRHDARTWLRFNMVNLHTRERHVRELADALLDAATRCAATKPK